MRLFGSDQARGLTRSLPTVAALAAGGLVALACLAMPAAWLEGGVARSGVAALLPVAEPPLGLTARVLLAMGGGGGVAAVAWAALYLLVGPGGPLAPRSRGDGPTVRRADAHPDAPPRRPLSAADLPAPPPPAQEASPEKVPVPMAPAEQPVPVDLDVPLAAFDPAALPAAPLEPAPPVKPLVPALAPGERLETYILTPPPPPPPPPPPVPRAAPAEPPSIDSLLRRLEQGARRNMEGRRVAGTG